MSWISLAHPLSETTPLYGGGDRVTIARVRSMAAGQTSNNSELALPAHAGTHIDAPRHFDPTGRTLDSYPADHWHAERPWLIDCVAEAGELLGLARLALDLEAIPLDCDLLLLRTGFEQRRATDPETYSLRGPGLAPEVCDWLRRHRRLRMLGLDFISVSSFSHRDEGRQAHRALLAAHDSGTEPILPVEDMALGRLATAPAESWIIPILFLEADGAPVTAVARL
jgi:kynurenine formamidase